MKPAIIDVRRVDEWNAGHVEGALNLPLEEIMDGKVPDMNKDQTIYLYCRSGSRSGLAEQILRSKGFVNVVNAGSLLQAQRLVETS